MNWQTIKSYLKTHSKPVLSIISISVIFPTILADYNQRAEISKVTYEVDYKSAKNKYLECNKEHDKYISSLKENAVSAGYLQQYYNIDRLQQPTNSQAYFIFFNGLIDTYRKTLSMNEELSSKASFCYKELDNLYENLALSLNVSKEYKKIIKNSDIHIIEARNKRNQLVKELENKYKENFLNDTIEALINENDEKIFEILRELNFGDLSNLQNIQVRLETDLFNVKQKQIYELNQLFSKEINTRFHHGIRSYFLSFTPFS
ncbi:hypothetical protein [Acinetobacter baumannii]|uniref:hypothetical protein n=1 Tax=Acinetobacter baumannii TaxID=470 RepID=UPI002341E776|nr:hypothetical protein [Acinetobacter baumannii]MDC5103946.1 hypothetical protein [Acinetobacter baumannii]MDC5175551.1 hypothetical protein [Acinetobacter baumannii]